MPAYQMNDGAFDLPEEFSDGTMHIFSTGKDAASRFTFVVSRADMEAGDTVETFVQRLVAHMRKTLPRFELKNVLVRDIGGETAREIDYLWLSEGAPLHQRQTVVCVACRQRSSAARDQLYWNVSEGFLAGAGEAICADGRKRKTEDADWSPIQVAPARSDC
ncbi:hypothetical protein bAD24_p01500 (plasmid) [Burkholderia sp. AD24]|nr:hypothetical protein bAD24_p01500 [Burkholderia sp. AD24]